MKRHFKRFHRHRCSTYWQIFSSSVPLYLFRTSAHPFMRSYLPSIFMLSINQNLILFLPLFLTDIPSIAFDCLFSRNVQARSSFFLGRSQHRRLLSCSSYRRLISHSIQSVRSCHLSSNPHFDSFYPSFVLFPVRTSFGLRTLPHSERVPVFASLLFLRSSFSGPQNNLRYLLNASFLQRFLF